MAMTRTEALRKLLALGAMVRGEIVDAMGGQPDTVLKAIDDLRASGQLTYRNCGRNERLYQLTQSGSAEAFA